MKILQVNKTTIDIFRNLASSTAMLVEPSPRFTWDARLRPAWYTLVAMKKL